MLVSEHGRRTYWKLGVRDLSLDVFNGIEEGDHLRISLPVVRKRGNEEIEHRDLWFDFRVSQYSCKDRNIGRVLQGVQKEMEGN